MFCRRTSHQPRTGVFLGGFAPPPETLRWGGSAQKQQSKARPDQSVYVGGGGAWGRRVAWFRMRACECLFDDRVEGNLYTFCCYSLWRLALTPSLRHTSRWHNPPAQDLPYGTMKDDEMVNLNVGCLQDNGVLFLWVTGERAAGEGGWREGAREG